MNTIIVKGARVHNLKNININLPVKKLICLAGPSGSGKTSLAFHTLLAESKRRFINSFPNSMKFFSDRPAPVDVDSIFPVLPVFGLPQINPILGSRAVVVDVMRLLESLQALYFRFSTEVCPQHGEELKVIDHATQIQLCLGRIYDEEVYHIILYRSEYEKVFGQEFLPSRSFDEVHKSMRDFDNNDEAWEVFRFKGKNISSISKKWDELKLSLVSNKVYIYSKKMSSLKKLHITNEKSCSKCDFKSSPVLSSTSFSPYNALGACPHCNGYGANLIYDDNKLINKDKTILEDGFSLLRYAPFEFAKRELIKILKKEKIPLDIPIKKLPPKVINLVYEGQGRYPGYEELKRYLDSKKYKPSVRVYIRNLQKEEPCKFCLSSRINPKVHHFKLKFNKKQLGLHEIVQLSIDEIYELVSKDYNVVSVLDKKIIKDILDKLITAKGIGLGHLDLIRKVKSISAGEYQRLLLIKYLSFKGTDSLFVLDEPSLGLSKTEEESLLKGISEIIEQGNTVVIIDHSEFLQKSSDYLIVMGPGSGKLGGEIIYEGSPQRYFNKRKSSPIPVRAPRGVSGYIEVSSVEIFNKKYKSFKLPINSLTWVHGDSGTGKTACIVRGMANSIYFKTKGQYFDESVFKIDGLKYKYDFEDIIIISSELNRFTSRSSIGTITELSSAIRKHFLKLPISKAMNLKEGHFSSNSDLGMCPKCVGKGNVVIEMQYLEDIVLECEDCKGQKIKPLYANISDGQMTVYEAYNLPLSQVLERIELTPKFKRVWEYLKILNLDYLSLDRGLSSLSGGERQRIYLLSKLLKKVSNSLIIFENISFGLSALELEKLSQFLVDLIKIDNTIVIIDSSNYFKHLASWEISFLSNEIISKDLTR